MKEIEKRKNEDGTYTYWYKNYPFYYDRHKKCWFVITGNYEKNWGIINIKKYVQDYDYAIRYIDSIAD